MKQSVQVKNIISPEVSSNDLSDAITGLSRFSDEYKVFGDQVRKLEGVDVWSFLNVSPEQNSELNNLFNQYEAHIKNIGNGFNTPEIISGLEQTFAKIKELAEKYSIDISDLVNFEGLQKLQSMSDSAVTSNDTTKIEQFKQALEEKVAVTENAIEANQRLSEEQTKTLELETTHAVTQINGITRALQEATEETKTLGEEIVKIGEGSTGDVFRVGDFAYKATEDLTGKKGIEAEVYEKMKGIEGITQGILTELMGVEAIQTRIVDRFISVHEITKKLSDGDLVDMTMGIIPESVKQDSELIAANYDRIVKAMSALSQAGYDYNDQVQLALDKATGKLDLIDFSTTRFEGIKVATERNLNLLGVMFKNFQLPDLAKVFDASSYMHSVLQPEFDVSKAEESLVKLHGKMKELFADDSELSQMSIYFTGDTDNVNIEGVKQYLDEEINKNFVFSPQSLTQEQMNQFGLKPVKINVEPQVDNTQVKQVVEDVSKYLEEIQHSQTTQSEPTPPQDTTQIIEANKQIIESDDEVIAKRQERNDKLAEDIPEQKPIELNVGLAGDDEVRDKFDSLVKDLKDTADKNPITLTAGVSGGEPDGSGATAPSDSGAPVTIPVKVDSDGVLESIKNIKDGVAKILEKPVIIPVEASGNIENGNDRSVLESPDNIAAVNAAWKEHEEKVREAIKAEQDKFNESVKLVGQLENEKKAFDDIAGAVDGLNEKLSKVEPITIINQGESLTLDSGSKTEIPVAVNKESIKQSVQEALNNIDDIGESSVTINHVKFANNSVLNPDNEKQIQEQIQELFNSATDGTQFTSVEADAIIRTVNGVKELTGATIKYRDEVGNTITEMYKLKDIVDETTEDVTGKAFELDRERRRVTAGTEKEFDVAHNVKLAEEAINKLREQTKGLNYDFTDIAKVSSEIVNQSTLDIFNKSLKETKAGIDTLKASIKNAASLDSINSMQKQLGKVKDIIETIATGGIKGLPKEFVNLQSLFDTASSPNVSVQEQIKAYNELMQLYPKLQTHLQSIAKEQKNLNELRKFTSGADVKAQGLINIGDRSKLDLDTIENKLLKIKGVTSAQVTNIKNADGYIKSFTASVSKANGETEKLNFALADVGKSKSLVQIGESVVKRAKVSKEAVVVDISPTLSTEDTANQSKLIGELKSKLDDVGKILNSLRKDREKGIVDDKTLSDASSSLSSIGVEMNKLAQSGVNVDSLSKKFGELTSNANSVAKTVGSIGGKKVNIDFNKENIAETTKELKNLVVAKNEAHKGFEVVGEAKFIGENVAKIDLLNKKLNEVTTATIDLTNATQGLDGVDVQLEHIGLSEDGLKQFATILESTGNKLAIFKREKSAALGNQEIKAQVEALEKELVSLSNAPDSTKTVQMAKDTVISLKEIETNAKIAGVSAKSWFDGIGNSMRRLSQYLFGAGVFGFIGQNLRQIQTHVKDLDAAMVRLSRVTDMSEESMRRFAVRAFEAGREVGRTGREVMDAVTEFRRAGYELEQAFSLGTIALTMTNIGDGIRDVESASSGLIAILRGFNYDESQAQRILDSINEVNYLPPRVVTYVEKKVAISVNRLLNCDGIPREDLLYSSGIWGSIRR
jgi:hypothetical protein